jgi:hypothetical protein
VKAPFNRDFYVTVATIMPVLYLALTLQGSSFAHMVSQSGKALGHLRRERGEPSRRRLWLSVRSFGLIVGAIAVLYAWLTGELRAMTALYHQSDTPGDSTYVVLCLIVLLIAATTGPFVTFFRTLNEAVKQSDSQEPELAGTAQQHNKGGSGQAAKEE